MEALKFNVDASIGVILIAFLQEEKFSMGIKQTYNNQIEQIYIYSVTAFL